MSFRISVVAAVLIVLLPAAFAAERDINWKVAQLKIGQSTLGDVTRVFGEPSRYVWSNQTLQKNNLPQVYIAVYSEGMSILIRGGKVGEVRFEGQGGGYYYQGKISVGSSLDEALKVIGKPVETLTGRKNDSKDGVLYKDIEGRAGECYYSRPDKGIRCFFADNKITALYITGNVPSAVARRQDTGRTESKPSAPVSVKPRVVTTKQAGPVEWKENKIVSRVLPYPDFTSLFIRLPIAHAAVDGNGVKVAVVGLSNDAGVKSAVEQVAPGAQVTVFTFSTSMYPSVLVERVVKASNRIVVIADADKWNANPITDLARQLQSAKILVVAGSDLSDDSRFIETINELHSIGVLTVGRVDRQSLVMQSEGDRRIPFNSRIRDIETDVFSTIGAGSEANPTAAAAGVAALVLGKWPDLTPAEVRGKIVKGARNVWQATSIETGQFGNVVFVDSVTTQYTPINESAIFRFRVLDAAGAVGVDTEIPWFLNMLNVQKAWEITKGQGVLVVVSDQGFHIRHPALVNSIIDTAHFGPKTLDETFQNFHGTDMSRILLSVAPKCKIIPILCSGSMDNRDELAGNIAKSFDYAVEHKADVISASWAGFFADYPQMVDAARRAVDKGVVVSWFHYPKAYPGLLRSRFTYGGWGDEQCIGFADRFLTDEPGFHPVEIEAGLSGTAPQAAGIAALVKSVNPQLKPVDIEKLIFDNSTPIGGNVRIPDAYKIVLAAKQMVKAGE